MIEPGFQALLAKEYGYGPVNRKTTINAASLPMSPVGDRAAKLLNVDWDVINDKRDEWTKRWNREVER
jgi:putative spermidine/putrescine transport system substrate-binding protein